MKNIYVILFVIISCLMIVMTINAEGKIDIEGIWEGKLQVPGSSLRIVFRIAKTPEGNLTATMDSPEQGITSIPIHYLTKELPGLNHIFQTAETGSPDEYAQI